RAALNRGFSVNNLRLITKLSLEIVRQEIPLHPAIPFTIGMLSRRIADSWDGVAISTAVADRVEDQIKPHFERLLGLANGDSATVCAAIERCSGLCRSCVQGLGFRFGLIKTGRVQATDPSFR